MANTYWLSGLSKSGKTAIADGVVGRLNQEGFHVQLLDGSEIRKSIGNYLGYSKGERIKASRILAVMANLLNRNGITVVVTSIMPYEDLRRTIRNEVDCYHEVFVDASLQECIGRDTSGFYKLAIQGDINNFIGITEPFEIPKNPELILQNGDGKLVESSETLYCYIHQHMEQ